MKLKQNFDFAEKRNEFVNGIKFTLPLILGAIPFGIIFGALSVANGLSQTATMAMSLFVFAGASQFIAAGMIAQQTSLLLIVFTTFIVNLRHILYSATLSPHVSHLPQKWLLPLGFWLTDETFMVTHQRYQEKDVSKFKHWFFFGSALSMYINWNLCTFIGIAAGQRIHDPGSWGLDFAMVVTFIGMLIPMIKSSAVLLAALSSGFFALLFYQLPNRLGMFIAAVIGITVGVITEKISNKHSEKMQ